jgi:hypothetical protein
VASKPPKVYGILHVSLFMAKLVYRKGPDKLPDIELTREEWDTFRSNTWIRGSYSKPPDKLNSLDLGGFTFYCDDDLLGMRDK